MDTDASDEQSGKAHESMPLSCEVASNVRATRETHEDEHSLKMHSTDAGMPIELSDEQ
jgi:hypothetical protein